MRIDARGDVRGQAVLAGIGEQLRIDHVVHGELGEVGGDEVCEGRFVGIGRVEEGDRGHQGGTFCDERWGAGGGIRTRTELPCSV